MLQIFKFKIITDASIVGEEDSGRSEKLLRFIKIIF